jgi:hypothetical protein
MTRTAHPLADDYLRRLERAARSLPRSDREELLAQIRSHLDAGLTPDATEGQVRNLLIELGPPEDIVAAAGPDRPPARRGIREIAALVLLVTGFPPVIGWLAGLALFMWSPLWSGRQKLLGALVWPGGLVVAGGSVGLMAARPGGCSTDVPNAAQVTTTCTSAGPSAWSVVAIALFLVAPVVVAGYLYVVAGRRSAAG